MAALLVTGCGADELEIGDGVSGLQDPLEGGGQALGLGAGEIVIDRAAAVVVGLAAEDGGEALVGSYDREVRAEQHETEGRLAENGLRGRQVRLDTAQGADIHDDAERGRSPLPVSLGIT